MKKIIGVGLFVAIILLVTGSNITTWNTDQLKNDNSHFVLNISKGRKGKVSAAYNDRSEMIRGKRSKKQSL